MKQLKNNLKAVAKDLKKLTEKTEKMIERLKKLDKAEAAKKPKAKAARKTVARKTVARKTVARKSTKVSASGAVLAAITKSRKGVDTAALKKKTGLEGRKLRDIVYRLNKQGKIKRDPKGLYVKA